MPPTCQPVAAHFGTLLHDCGLGIIHRALIARMLRTSKSESPRRNRGSKAGGLDTELPNVSPAIPDELVSMLFENVYEVCSWTPWLSRLIAANLVYIFEKHRYEF